MQRIRVNITLTPGVELPAYQTAQSAGFDLAPRVTVTLAPNQTLLAPTGVVVECPIGYYLQVVARSSLPLKKGLVIANAVGIIDPDYSGPSDEIFLQLRNISDRSVTVAAGERVAQGIFVPFVQAEFVSTTATRPNRGGIGSTGGYHT